MTESALKLADSPVEFTYIDKHGESHLVSASPGESLMEVATFNEIEGIDGDCGGCCACGTCRVYLDPGLGEAVSDRGGEEEGVLDFSCDDPGDQRLGCQVKINGAFAGVTIRVAP